MKNKIRNIMNDSPVCLKETENINTVLQKIHETKVSQILMVDKKNELSGIITKNDLYSYLKKMAKTTSSSTYTNLELNAVQAKEIMTPNPITLNSNAEIQEAVMIFLNNNFHSIPIVEKNTIEGIVSPMDLLRSGFSKNEK